MRETYDLKNDAFISQLEARVRRKIETNVVLIMKMKYLLQLEKF